MKDIDKLIQNVQKIQHGFLDIQKTANDIVEECSVTDSRKIAEKLYRTEIYQARSLATFIFGRLAAGSEEILVLLKCKVSKDNDWRVQEILAKAFDRYCSDIGYESALPVIREWLSDPAPTVRRAVTEGLRIWTGRPFFRDHPQLAVNLLSQLRDDESVVVRKSVGNALRDISKKHGGLVKNELAQWDISKINIKQTYKLANRFLTKKSV